MVGGFYVVKCECEYFVFVDDEGGVDDVGYDFFV